MRTKSTTVNTTKEIIAWCLYDWASNAFPILITTFIFATYFTTKIASNPINGTHEWGNATALAGILVALLGPLFGAISDHAGHHKRWLLLFSLMTITCCALLWFAYPNVSAVNFTLTCFVIGTISYEIALIFYNSFLPHIAPEGYIGRISGWAWGAGYMGGIALLTITLVFFIEGKPSWLNTATAEHVRITGPLVAAWFLVFSIPLFIFIPETPGTGLTKLQAIKQGLFELGTTLKSLPKQKNLFLYLIAHMVYADALNTLFAFGGIYAAGTFGMSLSQVILFGITMNISSGLGAVLLAWVDDLLGSKPTILISLVCLILFGLPLLLVHNYHWFWGIALIMSLFLGPVQAASRSLMARLTPPQKSTEMFGLYAFSGRITAFTGPWVLGMATLYFQSQRAGMATILIFFVIGTFLMWHVKEPHGKITQNSI